jgi:hypothetical protein
VWVTSDGQVKLLDFRAPGARAEAMPGVSVSTRSAQRFLHAVACRALGTSTVPFVPLSASAFLRRLAAAEFGTLADVVEVSARLVTQHDHVTRSQRGMALALGVTTYLLGARPLGHLLTKSALAVLISGGMTQISVSAGEVGAIGCAVLGLLSAATWRSGLWLRAFGIAVVTRDGSEASPLRAASRAALAWSWIPAQLLAVACRAPVLPVVALEAIALIYASVHPERGLQDRLAGTYLVPR